MACVFWKHSRGGTDETDETPPQFGAEQREGRKPYFMVWYRGHYLQLSSSGKLAATSHPPQGVLCHAFPPLT